MQTVYVQSEIQNSAELETSCTKWNSGVRPIQLSFLLQTASDNLPTASYQFIEVVNLI